MGTILGSKLSCEHKKAIAEGMRGNKNAKGNHTPKGKMPKAQRAKIAISLKRTLALRARGL